MKNIDVTAFGEILIDFTYSGKTAEGKKIYVENPGGAPANCVCGVAKLGGKAAFIGMTGEDSFGDDLRKTLEELNVNVSGLKKTCKQHTTLAFVTLEESGERHFSFCRKPGADTQITESDLDVELLKNTKILHIGSLSLTDEPAKSTTLKAISIVKAAGGLISYDPNWRENLWQGKENPVAELKSLLKYADIVKVSDEELKLLYGNISFEQGVEEIHKNGVKLVMITLGGDGVYYSVKGAGLAECSGKISVPKVKVVDTTGAGDSFNAGLLYSLTRSENPLKFSEAELIKNLQFANSVASICVTRYGGIPALPDFSEAEEFMKKHY